MTYFGRLAQLGERLVYTQKVISSSLVPPKLAVALDRFMFLAGKFAGETHLCPSDSPELSGSQLKKLSPSSSDIIEIATS